LEAVEDEVLKGLVARDAYVLLPPTIRKNGRAARLAALAGSAGMSVPLSWTCCIFPSDAGWSRDILGQSPATFSLFTTNMNWSQQGEVVEEHPRGAAAAGTHPCAGCTSMV